MTLPRVVKWNCCKSRQTRLIDGYLWAAAWFLALMLVETSAQAQVNVFTAHNDTARTGQNVHETILTPSNVNPTQFGKLFSHPVNGSIWAQPLYVANVTINGILHNVVYVATTGNYEDNKAQNFSGDYVYAFDADTNGGANANPLWQVSLLTAPVPTAGAYPYQFGVVGTPVIDPSTGTMYLVDAEMLNGVYVHRLHALDITTGAEKFGGPVQIQASIPGTGSGSSNGMLTFNDGYQFQRPALLLMNGVVYIGFGAVNDEGPWHGWLLSYNAATLQQIDVFCTTPNGSGGGVWMGGAGLAGEVYNPAKPFGRLFFATGNGTGGATFGIGAPTVPGQPYSNPSNEYGMSLLDLDLTNGMFTVEDEFTPFNESSLNSHDADLGSGGPLLLPTQTLASGLTLNALVQIGKTGMFYILDRDNSNDGSNNPGTEYSPAGLGGFNSTADQVVQEVQTPETTPGFNWGAGVWGTTAYWNNTIYSGGTNVANPTNAAGPGTPLSAYSFVNGVLSTTPTSQSAELYSYASPTPSISANGNTNGILWLLHHGSGVDETLQAYDATNLANLLYSSNTNLTQDNPGVAEEYIVPTIANGKVVVGTSGFLSVYGLLAGGPREPTFQQMPGSLQQVSVGTDGSIWGINSADAIFFYNSQTQAWQMVPGSLSQIAVGANGYIWGLNAGGNIYRFDPATQNWDSIPGNLSQIAVGSDGDVWGINSGHGVYHFVWAAQGWEYVPTTLTQIAVGFDGAVWGLGSAGNSNGLDIYRFNVGTRLFEQVPGELSQIAVGADGDVWGLNAENSIYHFNTLVQNWEQIPGSLSQISVGSATNVWGLNSSGNVYTFNNQAQNWMQIAGTLKQISAGENGSAWGVNSANNIYRFIQPHQPTNAWHAVPGASLTQVAVGVDNNVWALDGTAAIYHYDPLIQNWENVPGSLSQIAVGFGGDVWGINSGRSIYRYNASIQNWENVPGELAQIAVGANGDVWGINSGGYIYRFDLASLAWEWIPGELKQLSVGVDGAVWGINTSGQIWRYDRQIQGWDGIPGQLAQIAVGSSSNIWGLNAGGYIYQFNLQTQNWNSIPGNLSQIAIGFDGTVWGINSASQIFRYGTQLPGWDYVPGSLNQITVGADAAVWGVNSAHGGYRFW